MVTKIIE